MSRSQTKIAGLVCLLVAVSAAWAFQSEPGDEWTSYGRDPGGQRYSPLHIINRGNVAHLKMAWTMRTGDAYQPKYSRPTAFEATPLYIDGTLYVATPLGKVMALDAISGSLRWTFDGKVPRDKGYGDFANRGVSTWKGSNGPRRIYIATVDARLIALDAATGKPIPGFGDEGTVDLRKGLRIPPRNFSDYEETSPPAVIGNTLVVGSGIADNGSVGQASGEVRGFDAVTGKLKWTWDPIPQTAGTRGADTWKGDSAKRTGAANAWSVIAADSERNIVYVPTGSASPDYYGGERLGANLFANSVVALRADTGEVVWHFQTVHHDLWDYDVASPPILFDVHRGGTTIPAVGAGSKTGHFFVLNRDTGEPVFGVEERQVPKSDVAGEVASPTQPFPVAPKALSPQSTVPWGVDEASRKWCEQEIGKLRSEGVFTPPSVKGSLVIPGNVGGMAWGGASYDAQKHILVIPVNNLAVEVRLIPRAEFGRAQESGRKLNGDWEFAEQAGTPYGMARRILRSPSGLPCTAPPWGMLKGIDGDTGEIRWSVPLGRLPKLGEAPAPPKELGSLVLGGPISTAGGLTFIAGTLDRAIYAFDIDNGKELWRGELPTTARATPMTYRAANGKQYVVIAAGGHGIEPAGPVGDYLVAFTLE